MLKTRIITSLVAVPALFGILYAGGLYWKALFTLLALLGVCEYLNLLKAGGHKPLVLPALLATVVSMWGCAIGQWLLAAILVVLFLSVLLLVIEYPRYSLADVALTLFGSFYIGFLLAFSLPMADLDKAFWIITLCFFITWGSDIGGYVGGSLAGRHRLAPQLSPNKTWEGAAGAVLLATLLAVLLVQIVDLPVPVIQAAALGMLGSAAAQMGDLFESGMKRYAGVKDSGRIIPGHGGVLDRFDSFLLVLPLVYTYFYYFGQ